MSDYREILARKILRNQDEIEKNQLTIQDRERNIELNEEDIIRFKIENDILVDEIKFLKKRRKENE